MTAQAGVLHATQLAVTSAVATASIDASVVTREQCNG